MIAASPQVGYLQEPFNPTCVPGVCAADFRRLFTYVTWENEEKYRKPIQDTLAFRFNVAAGLKGSRSAQDLRLVLGTWKLFNGYRNRRLIPLFKDPVALFSAGWLAERFGMRVIVLLRHPAAFVSSVKTLNWGCPFEDLLAQPLLVRDHLEPFLNEMRAQMERPRDLIAEGILFWRIYWHTVQRYRERYPEWVFIRHEEIASDPMRHYAELYAALGLEFTPQVEATIREHSQPSNPADVGHCHDFKRSSADQVQSWKRRLTEEEVARIRRECAPLAAACYAEEDW